MKDFVDAPTTAPSFNDGVRAILDDLDRLRPQIEAALEYANGTHTYDDVCVMVMQGRLRFWPMKQSFIMTEIITYPRKKLLHGFLAGGSLDEIITMQNELVKAAKEADCYAIALSGRRGWVKALKPLGWKEDITVCIFEVN